MPQDTRSEWQTLDKDLKRISQLELAATYVSRPLVGLGVGLAFVIVAGLTAAVFFGTASGSLVVVLAAIFGAYMALNIGANDVANNMGPAVGANALPMAAAIALAAVCESAGALLAGGDVIQTVSREIISPEPLEDPETLVWAMLAASLSAALWVNLATLVRAPVSTTHAVIGGILGAGIAAAGLGAVNWSTIGQIASGWLVAPLLGGGIAAALLALIKTQIMFVSDKLAAARFWLPILIGLMAGSFVTYLAIKGLNRLVSVSGETALLTGLVVGSLTCLLARPLIRRQAEGLENRNRSLKALFTVPLILSAALLSFAHGANDVANAVGPLAAIVHTVEFGSFAAQVPVPVWVMMIGAFGISFGLFLFGPRLIRMVGQQITRLNPMRAYCVALSTAITVILASWLGLPVSSTHVAVGGVFGVGLFREWYMAHRLRKSRKFYALGDLMAHEEHRRRRLVRRSHLLSILAAWVVTVPASALMSAVLFQLLQVIIS